MKVSLRHECGLENLLEQWQAPKSFFGKFARRVASAVPARVSHEQIEAIIQKHSAAGGPLDWEKIWGEAGELVKRAYQGKP